MNGVSMATAPALPKDPLDSPMWETVANTYLKGAPVAFSEDVRIGLPPVTEDQTQVPIMIDASKVGAVDEVVVIADLSPFPLTLKVSAQQAPVVFAFRVRIEQGTAIRAAARKNGQWLVGARYLDAAGGGCSAPPNVEARIAWDDIGQMRAKLWREDGDQMRLRVRVMHPMDTGLHKEPAFFIQSLAIDAADGGPLAKLEVHEPIAANPVFTVQFADPKRGDHVALVARDNDGGIFRARVPLLGTAANASIVREGRL